VLCAMPSGDKPECSCCVGLRSLDAPASRVHDGLAMETTSGHRLRWSHQRAKLMASDGATCADYQAFWD